jgi:hypothetical protein
MIPKNFRFWSTKEDETLPINYKTYTAKPRRAQHFAPYPTRPSSDVYPLKSLRSKVPKPLFNLETTEIASPGPSESQKPDSALVALEHCHGADTAQEADAATKPSPNPPALHPLALSTGPLETNPSPNPPAFHPLAPSTGPQKNQEFDAARPAPESLVLQPGPPEKQKPDAAAKPAPDLADDSLLLITGPPENQELDVTPPQDLSTPQLTFYPAVQHNSSRSPTPHWHSGETGDKARLIAQDVQEKDRMIEILKDEVSD